MGKAIYQSCSDRVAEWEHDDWDRAGRILRGLGGWGGAYCDDVGFAANTVGSEGWKLLATALRGKVIDRDGLPIHIAQITQTLEKRVKSC